MGFGSGICDGAGVTRASIAIFHFCLSVTIRAVRLTFKRPDSLSLKEILQADPLNPSREGGCKKLGVRGAVNLIMLVNKNTVAAGA